MQFALFLQKKNGKTSLGLSLHLKGVKLVKNVLALIDDESQTARGFLIFSFIKKIIVYFFLVYLSFLVKIFF